MPRITICREVQCPFFDDRNGCEYYAVSDHCHLKHPGNNVHRNYIEHNQYFLFADEDNPQLDLELLRAENASKIASHEGMQRRIKRKLERLG